MTVAAMREQAHELINDVDDSKMESVLALLKEEVSTPYDWSQDEEFLAELDERMQRYEAGIDKGYTLEEVKANLEQFKKEHRAKSAV